MLVTFLETRRVSEDSFTVRLCEAGKSYDLADTCARNAINQKWAYEPRMRSPHVQNVLKAFGVNSVEAYAILPTEN